jgi:aminoglycoside phosphotransferase (APT) family kinase protein
LPVLASHLSFPIPEPLALGNPMKDYPWHWSIYRWIEEVSANILALEDVHLQLLALQLAQFVRELHKIPAINGPTPGSHNYWRGFHLSVYDTEIKSAIIKLEVIIDGRDIIAVWERAICSEWNHQPVWAHGDFSIGNFLMNDGRLAAIIDFGCMGVGDPVCDLVIVRKSSIELVILKNKKSLAAIRHQEIIKAILNENKLDDL